MNVGGHKAKSWLVGVVILMSLLGGCAPGAAVEATPTMGATLTRETEAQPTPEPTDTSIPPTSTPGIPGGAPEPDFSVCDAEPEGISLESTPSPEAGIPVEVDALIPPAPPARVEAVMADDGLVVTWQGTGTDVDQFYKLYRREAGDDCWQLVGIQPIEGDNQGAYTYSLPLPDQPGEYLYAVTTVDIYGNESELSQVAEPGSGS